LPPEFTAFIVAIVVAGLLLAGLLLTLPRGRSVPARRPRGLARSETGTALDRPDRYARPDADPTNGGHGPMGAPYSRAVRIAWWVSIASVLVGVGLTGAFAETQPLIYGLGAIAAVTVVVMHELLPTAWRVPGRFWIEAVIGLALVSGLLVATGYAASPFWVGYPLVTVAVALARGRVAAVLFSAVATAAIVGVVWFDPGEFGALDLVRIGAQIGAIWLLTALAAVYAGQERELRDRFVTLSLTDPLTGLFNRSQIYATLDLEVRRTRRSERGFCLLMIDLDGLKAVNDSFGHHRGDDVLRHLGAVIRRSIRTVDSAYRYGGDEFVVLLPETDIVGAFVVAEKIRAGTEEMGIALANGGAEASVSIGLVSHPEDGLTVEELMIAADRAMYQAKSLGKNQISGYPRPRRAAPPSLPGGPPPTVTPVEAVAAAEPAAAGEPESIAASVSEAEAAAPEAPAEVAAAAPPPQEEAVGSDAEALPKGAVAAETPEMLEPRGLAPVEMGPSSNGHGDDEPDPGEVRRQIAAASRSFDPDHQIRRAMDAFLGPMSDPRDRH
jgi:diguanylate cyclase (GGDEF)-like protein